MAFCVEVLLFVAFVACATSFGFAMLLISTAIRIYFLPAEPFQRGFDAPFGPQWLLLPMFWGIFGFLLSTLKKRCWRSA